MVKKESRKGQEIKNPTFDKKKLKSSSSPSVIKEKSLPWWVELLFVQIGLPDKMLIKILKSKRIISDAIRNEKRFLIKFLFALAALAYFYPVIKYSKTKLDCEATAKSYIVENKNIKAIKKTQLRMLSTNFCNGGDEIYEIENIK